MNLKDLPALHLRLAKSASFFSKPVVWAAATLSMWGVFLTMLPSLLSHNPLSLFSFSIWGVSLTVLIASFVLNATPLFSVSRLVNQKYLRFALEFRTFIKSHPLQEHAAYEKLAQYLVMQKDHHYVDLKEGEQSTFTQIIQSDFINYIIQSVNRPQAMSEEVASSQEPSNLFEKMLDFFQIKNSPDKNLKNIFLTISPEKFSPPPLALPEALAQLVNPLKLQHYVGQELKEQNISYLQLAKEIKRYRTVKTFHSNQTALSVKFVAYLLGALAASGQVLTGKELQKTLRYLSHQPTLAALIQTLLENIQTTQQLDYVVLKNWCATRPEIGLEDIQKFNQIFEEKLKKENAQNVYKENTDTVPSSTTPKLAYSDFFQNTLSYLEPHPRWSATEGLATKIQTLSEQLYFVSQSQHLLDPNDLVELKLMFQESVPQIYHYFSNFQTYSEATQKLTLAPTLQNIETLEALADFYREKIENAVAKKVLVQQHYLQGKSSAVLGEVKTLSAQK